jgi:hypothetical protein
MSVNASDSNLDRAITSSLVNIWYISPTEVRNSSVDVNFEVSILRPAVWLSEDLKKVFCIFPYFFGAKIMELQLWETIVK